MERWQSRRIRYTFHGEITMGVQLQTQETIYPESDGKPMADNTKQFHWILYLYEGIASLFQNDPNVFVAGDLLWYPVEGDNQTRVAADVMVVFGRPKGHRGSYLQWKEENIAPQVVFEVLSPSNTVGEMVEKFRFYERYGVEEYYLYDPDRGKLEGWVRAGEGLQPIEQMEGWVSPRLGVTFSLEGADLVLKAPDGEPFLSYGELQAQRLLALQEAEAERQRAEAERQRAEAERQRAEAAEQRAQRLAQRLKELGIDPDES